MKQTIAIFSSQSEALQFILRSKFNWVVIERNGLYYVEGV